MTCTKAVKRGSLVVGFLLFVAVSWAQKDMAIDGKSILELRQQNSHFQPLTPFFSSSSFTPLSSSPAPSVFQQKAAAPSIYSCENLAFFCKIEVKLEQSTGFPVKFRLGNVEYVDRLEGKRK